MEFLRKISDKWYVLVAILAVVVVGFASYVIMLSTMEWTVVLHDGSTPVELAVHGDQYGSIDRAYDTLRPGAELIDYQSEMHAFLVTADSLAKGRISYCLGEPSFTQKRLFGLVDANVYLLSDVHEEERRLEEYVDRAVLNGEITWSDLRSMCRSN